MGEPFGKGWRRFRTREPQPGPEGSSDYPRRRRGFREPGRGARQGEAGEWATPSLAAIPASRWARAGEAVVATRRAPRGRGPPGRGLRVGGNAWRRVGGRWLRARIPCAALLRCPLRRSWGPPSRRGGAPARVPRGLLPAVQASDPVSFALLRLGNWNLKWFVFPHCSCSLSGGSS